MKFPPLLADAALAALLWEVARRRAGDGAARWAAAAYWANPAMILAGPVLGYLDALMALPAAGALVAAAGGLPAAAGALAAAACLTKAQAVFVLPVVALGLWRMRSQGAAARLWLASAAGAAVAAMVVAPYVAAGAWRNLVQGIASLLRHDMLSGDAANAWWIVTYVLRAIYAVRDLGLWGAWTMRVRILGISRVIALGYPNPRPFALAMVSAAAGWALWRVRRSVDLPRLAACAAFIVHGYFVLGVQVHENHLFLAIPLLAVAAACRPGLRPVCAALSAAFALNLYLVVGVGRGFPLPPRNLTIVDAMVLLAMANCALLAWHARRFARECAPEIAQGPEIADAVPDAALAGLRPGSTSRSDRASPGGSD